MDGIPTVDFCDAKSRRENFADRGLIISNFLLKSLKHVCKIYLYTSWVPLIGVLQCRVALPFTRGAEINETKRDITREH